MRDTDNEAELISTSDLDPASLQRVIEMRHVAFESWWAPGHPGWGIINEALPNGRAGKRKLIASHNLYRAHHQQEVQEEGNGHNSITVHIRICSTVKTLHTVFKPRPIQNTRILSYCPLGDLEASLSLPQAVFGCSCHATRLACTYRGA